MDAVVPGPHLYGEAVPGNVHPVSALEILYVSTRILPLILFVLFYILVLFIYPVLFTLSFIVLQSHILVLFVLCVYFRSFNLSSYCTNPLHIHFCYNFSCRFCSGTMASAFASAVFPRDY